MTSAGSFRLPRALIALAAVMLIPFTPPAQSSASPLGSGAGALDLSTAARSRWIVQLREPPLARVAPRVNSRRFDAASGRSAAYLSHLAAAQATVAARVRAVAPGARIERSYGVVLDGMSVKMNALQAEAVRSIPGVRAVTPDLGYSLDMYATPAQINAQYLWNRLGGQSKAGDGVKVAVIDAGIYVTKDSAGRFTGNPCFSDRGYAAPAGFPKGDTRFTNNKVIVARTYFRPDDPPLAGDDTPIPGPNGDGHGTHTAGTVACNAGTHVAAFGTNVTISGVAPRAYLMNYRVFYPSRSAEDFQTGNAYVSELVAAIEDAVKDGADVMSNSWGASYQNTRSWPDPMNQAAEAAVDAGVVMVFANGNAGPSEATVNAPANSPKVIGVGAVTKNATIAAGDVSVAGAPATLQGMPVDAALFGPAPAAVGPAGYVAAETVAPNGEATGCSLQGDVSPFAPGSMNGMIGLISRGTCDLSEKVYNAQRAGAIAAIVYNSAANGDALQTMSAGNHAGDVTIPSWFMRRSQGLAMRDYRAQHPTAQASFAPNARAVSNVGDVVAGFSSRGPTTDKIAKPDVVAPGVDVLSSGEGLGAFPANFKGFGAISGTSMATPHVAGSAALLVQLHRDWTPAQVKSALMSTAMDTLYTDSARKNPAGVLDRGAGRIDLARALSPGLTFDRPSISLGDIAAGRSLMFRVTATSVIDHGYTWDLSGRGTGISVATDVTSATVAAGRAFTFTVTVSLPAKAASGEHDGVVVVRNRATGGALHIPVNVRVVDKTPLKDVILLDDDGSSADPSLLDYSSVYKQALTDAGYSFDSVDVWNDGAPDLDTYFHYRAALLFTGNSASFDTSGFSEDSQDALEQWLDSGGRLLATGQNLAEASDSNSFDSARIGRARLYHGYLGVLQEAADVFGAVAPRPTATGSGPFQGVVVDVSPAGDGAGNQSSIEGMGVMFDNDSYQAPETMTPLFTPNGGNAPSGTKLGFARGSDPKLEHDSKYRYRSIAYGFGLEGVDGATGYVTRPALLRRSLQWLLDGMSAAITFTVHGAVNVRATGSSTAGAQITGARWDFGDRSPYVSGLSASHRYASRGTYTIRAEVADALGHTIVVTQRVGV